MAFDVQGLGRTSSNFNTITANALFTYNTAIDDLDTILQPGYFNSMIGLLKIGAHVFAKASNGTVLLVVINEKAPITLQFHTNYTLNPGNYAGSSLFPEHYPVTTDEIYGTRYEFSNLRLTSSWNPVGFPESIDPVKDGILFAPSPIDWSKPAAYQVFAMRDPNSTGGGFFSPLVQFPFRTIENIQCWAYLYYDDPSTATRLVLSQEATGADWESQGFDIYLTMQFYKL